MDYRKIIDMMLGDFSYNSFYATEKEPDPNFDLKELRMGESINKAIQQGARIKQQDQSGDKRSFSHIAVNRRFIEDGIRARIYLSPKQCNIHNLAIELINHSLHEGTDIYFKYARKNKRLDQMIIYLKNGQDVEQKLELLKRIRNENPQLFEDMDKSEIWFNQTEIPNVFLEPEPLFLNIRGEQTSYGACFDKALRDTKTILLYRYGVGDDRELKKYAQVPDFTNNFQEVFIEMLKRCGIYMKKNDKTNRYEIQGRSEGNSISYDFNYNKTTKELVETVYGKNQKDYRYPQNAKDVFFKSLLAEEINNEDIEQ